MATGDAAAVDLTHGAAELAVAPDAAQHRFTQHPLRLRRAGEPVRWAACAGMPRRITSLMHDDRRHFRPYTAEEADRLLASDPEDWSDLFDPLQVRPGLQSAMRPRGAARLGVPAPVAASLSLQVFGVGLIGFLLAGRASGSRTPSGRPR